MKKTIFLHYPAESFPLEAPVRGFRVIFDEEVVSISKSVEYMEKNILTRTVPDTEKDWLNIPLRSIVHISQLAGPDDIHQINQEIVNIAHSRNMLKNGKWPQVRLVITRRKEFVIFSGHHLLLAYLAMGKSLLKEIPFLCVYYDNREFMQDIDLNEFYGKLKRNIESSWRDYAIVTNLGGWRQLKPRANRNVGVMFDRLSPYLSCMQTKTCGV